MNDGLHSRENPGKSAVKGGLFRPAIGFGFSPLDLEWQGDLVEAGCERRH